MERVSDGRRDRRRTPGGHACGVTALIALEAPAPLDGASAAMPAAPWLILIAACVTALAIVIAGQRFARRRGLIAIVARAAAESRAKTVATAKLSPVGWLEIDPRRGSIVDADPIAIAWLGLPLDDVFGARPGDLLPGLLEPEPPPIGVAAQADVIHPGDGALRQLWVVREQDLAAGPSPREWLAFVDRTADRSLDRLLEAAHVTTTVQLALADSLHALNNVFTGLHGHAELLGDEVPAESWAMMRSAMERGWQVLGEVRRITETRGTRPHAPERFDTMLRRAVDLARRLVPQRITVELRTGAADLTTELDPDRLTTIVLALVRNARDTQTGAGRIRIASMPAGGSGRFVESCRDASMVRLEVHDDGDGMAAEVAARACERGFSTKGARGLGLPAVRDLVDAIDGLLRIDSEPGQGTVVAIAVPLAPEPSSAIPTVVHTAVHGRVLVVDDEPMVRSLAGRILRAAGYEVSEAPDASAALQALEHDPAAVLLTDIVMPDLDGGSLCQRARSTGWFGRTIYMSGHASALLARHDLVAGDKLLRKPFTEDELLAAVRDAITPPMTPAPADPAATVR